MTLVEVLRWFASECRRNGASVPSWLPPFVAAMERNPATGGHGRPEFDGLADGLDGAGVFVRTGPPMLLTMPEAAAVLGLSERTIRRLVAAGEITPVKVLGRPRLRRDDLTAYVAGLSQRPQTQETS